MLWIFTKKVKLFDTKDKALAAAREKLLRDAGIRTTAGPRRSRRCWAARI